MGETKRARTSASKRGKAPTWDRALMAWGMYQGTTRGWWIGLSGSVPQSHSGLVENRAARLQWIGGQQNLNLTAGTLRKSRGRRFLKCAEYKMAGILIIFGGGCLILFLFRCIYF